MSRPATYDMLQKNLGQDSRMTLQQKAPERCTARDIVLAVSTSRRISAHGDPHSDSEAIRAGGETYCLKQIGSYQTVVMATEFSRAGQ